MVGLPLRIARQLGSAFIAMWHHGNLKKHAFWPLLLALRKFNKWLISHKSAMS